MTERVKKMARETTEKCRASALSGTGGVVQVDLSQDWLDSGDLEELKTVFRLMGYGCEMTFPCKGAIGVQVYPNGMA